MIRPLRRTHLVMIVLLGAASAGGVALALTRRLDRPQAPTPARSDLPPWAGPVVAAMAWPVGRDTLYVELAQPPSDTAGPDARISTSAGARWPDAAVYWFGDAPGAALPVDAVALGVVAAGYPLVITLPRTGGALHLYSVAWDRYLGGWPLPAPGGRD